MKLKELVYLLGVKPRPKVYGFEVRNFDLPLEGSVQYAQWLHPRESAKVPDQAAITELRTFLKAGDVALDIGAHTGDSTLPIALALGPTGVVLALEPNRYVYPVLERNAQLNPDKTRIIPLMIAATAEDGPLEFEYSDAGFCNGGRHEGISKWRHGHAFKLEVSGRNVEKLLRDQYPELTPRIRYIKIDAEGYDHAVVSSIEGLIRAQRPYLKVEIYKHTEAEPRTAFLKFIESLGYRLHRTEGEGRLQGEVITAADATRWQHFDVFAVPKTSPGGG
jgi:FkbM family methyltransferase